MLLFIVSCSSDNDCHAKMGCDEGKCIYPCKTGVCNDNLNDKCSVSNHKPICIGNIQDYLQNYKPN